MSHTHFTTEQVTQLRDAARAGTRVLSARAMERLTWLEHFCTHGRSVTETCRAFAIPRMTLYRVLKRFNPADAQSLEDLSRRPHSSRPAAIPAELTELLRDYRTHVLRTDVAAVSAPQSSSSCAHPHCVICTLRRFLARWKRALVVSSVLVNIAFLAFLLGTALLEGHRVQAELTPHTRIENGTSTEELPDAVSPSLPKL